MSEEGKGEKFSWAIEEEETQPPASPPPSAASPPQVPLLPVHQASPMPIVLAAVSTGQMLLLKRFKDAVRQGKPIPNMHIIQPILLGGAGACAIGGFLSALGILRFDQIFKVHKPSIKAYMETAGKGVFMAFGTLGDVLPLAYVAIALAQAKYSIIFVTHASHQVLTALFGSAGVQLCTVSTPPVVAPEQKKLIDVLSSEIHMNECLNVIEGQDQSLSIKFIAINFFALEGWHLAEFLNVRCIVLAPYVMPYSMPSSFERIFQQVHPLLYERLQRALPGEVGWKDVTHWMWPLFLDRWTSWRVRRLRLSACTLTDPVTELPVHNWPRSVPLLYGFSEEIVECPGYWPSNVHACGFWLPPNGEQPDLKHFTPKLSEFLSCSKPIFIGLSSISSMGFLQNPAGMLQVIRDVMKRLRISGILFTAGHPSLEAAIINASGLAASSLEKEGVLLDHSLFCYSGYVPYGQLFPECSAVIHHGGSGTTAACLRAGVPQVICPFILDQFYWAERMAWLGVSPEPLKQCHLIPAGSELDDLSEAVDAVASAVSKALRSETKEKAMELATSIINEDGCSRAVRIIMEEIP